MGDLEADGAIGPGERSLLDRLPDQGSPRANWAQNEGVLRHEMEGGDTAHCVGLGVGGAVVVSCDAGPPCELAIRWPSSRKNWVDRTGLAGRENLL